VEGVPIPHGTSKPPSSETRRRFKPGIDHAESVILLEGYAIKIVRSQIKAERGTSASRRWGQAIYSQLPRCKIAADYAEGRIPKAIAEHERIAEAYGNPSLNLSREVFERIRAGEFTWERDFQDLHPSPFGHALYAAGVDRLLEAAWSGPGTMQAPRALPAEPMDSASYFHGRFAPLEEARIVQGFQLIPRWTPDLPAKTRPGFVDVPALVAACPGAELRIPFHGTAAGILIASGPKTGVLDVSCDGGPFRRFETATAWSQELYLPWTLILADDLPDGPHNLLLRLDWECNPQDATLVICRILINGVPAFSPKPA
jgi:sialidase-1